MKRSEVITELEQAIHSGDDELLKVFYSILKKFRNKKSEELYRLVYSSSRDEKCDEKCIENILESSRRNNPKHDITGMLLHTDKRFLQVLEGPYGKIIELYEEIKKDRRHGGSILRACTPIKERMFGDWNMAYKNVNMDDVEFRTEVSDENMEKYLQLMDGDIHNYTDDSLRILKIFLMV